MAISTSTGATYAIGPTTPASSAGDYANLSWVPIGDVEDGGEFGDAAEIITALTLADSRVRKLKGPDDAGDLALIVLHNPLDAGQLALIAAQKTKFSYAIRVTLADAADADDTDSVFYFHALVGSRRLNVGQGNNVTRRNFTLAITTPVVEVPSVAVGS